MKKSAQGELFQYMGLNLSLGIKLLLKQCINRGRIPFAINGKRPNAETIAAIEQLERGEGESFNSAEELFASWKIF